MNSQGKWSAFPELPEHKPGITRREYFAAQFMTAMLSDRSRTYQDIAKDAIAATEALLDELNENQQKGVV